MSIDKGYMDYDKFTEKIGILSEEELIALGWDADNGNRICYSKHEELVAFIDKLNNQAIQFIKGGKPKKYHIATDLDSCDLEEDYREEHGLTEDDGVVGDYIVNRVAYVNRMDYYLCDGDDNEELYLRYVEGV